MLNLDNSFSDEAARWALVGVVVGGGVSSWSAADVSFGVRVYERRGVITRCISLVAFIIIILIITTTIITIINALIIIISINYYHYYQQNV